MKICMRKMAAILAVASLLIATAAVADEPAAPKDLAPEAAANADDWKFGMELYLYGAALKGETAAGDRIDVEFDTRRST